MKKSDIARVVIAAVLAAGMLGGCATGQPSTASPQSSEAFAKSMAEAELVAGGSDKDGGIRMYQKIAADNPSRAEPWVRIAQIHFAQGNYGLAIVAAEETLRRDPANRQAKSVTAVGGLRLAARSLEELRKDSSLSGDTNADAQRLATLLRETLGTDVLVPAPVAAPAPRPRVRPAAAPRPGAAPAAAAAAAAATPPAAAPRPAPRSGGGNPFDALK